MSATLDSSTDAAEERAQVLTFSIDGQDYCVGLEHVAEIVDAGTMTTVPNTPEHIEGVMDLRGKATTIVNPLVLLEGKSIDPDELVTDGGKATHRVILLDEHLVDGEGATGWLVSAVSAVTDIPTDTRDVEGIADSPMFKGVVKRDDDDGFLI